MIKDEEYSEISILKMYMIDNLEILPLFLLQSK